MDVWTLSPKQNALFKVTIWLSNHITQAYMNAQVGIYYIGLTCKYELLGQTISKEALGFLPVKMTREVILSLFMIWIHFVGKQGCAWVWTV